MIRQGNYRQLAVVAACLILLTAALLILDQRYVERSGEESIVYLEVNVEGKGIVTVNGTSAARKVRLRRGSEVTLEAKPEKCWRFREWLLNGSAVKEEVLHLEVGGNTTVEAVFERAVHRLELTANITAAAVLVNSTMVNLPAVLKLPSCSLVTVKVVAPEGFEALNDTVELVVDSDRRLLFLFKKTSARIRLSNILVPVSVNGTIYAAEDELLFPLGSLLSISPYKADRRGCVYYNETHLACLVGWRAAVSGVEIPSRAFLWRVRGDERLVQVVVFSKLEYPVDYTEVQVPNGSVRVRVIPGDRWMIVPFQGEYRYEGDGWFRIEGEDWLIFVELPPNWSKVRVYANLTVADPSLPSSSVEVVVRNSEGRHFAVGRFLAPGARDAGVGYTVILFDRRVVDRYWNLTIDPFFDPLFPELVRLEACTLDGKPYRGCGPFRTGLHPPPGWPFGGPKEGIEEGWLRIEGAGVLRFKIVVVEWEDESG